MTDTYLLLIAAELGIVVIALLTGVIIEIINNCYMRRCHAEAQAEAKKAAANPLAQYGIPLAALQQGGQQTGVPPAPPCGGGEECKGDCKDGCGKPKETGQYL